MEAKQVPLDEVLALFPDEGNKAIMRRWYDRGDGIAVYENCAMDSANCGHHVALSFGSKAAQIEDVPLGAAPPEKMPDTGRFSTPWAYRLHVWARTVL